MGRKHGNAHFMHQILLAAAHAVGAHVEAYEITNEKKYLERADKMGNSGTSLPISLASARPSRHAFRFYTRFWFIPLYSPMVWRFPFSGTVWSTRMRFSISLDTHPKIKASSGPKSRRGLRSVRCTSNGRRES